MVVVTREEDGYVLSTPSLYPSGAPVRVRVSFDGRTCFVSDMGLASHEAEMLGATHRQFKRCSKLVADEMGVSFDDHSFFILQVQIERVAAAIKIVAAASHRASVMTELNISEQSIKNDRDLLLDKLISAFGSKAVDKDFEFVGKSGHTWAVVGRVRASHDLVFDTATPWHNSVVSVFAKFHDIKLVPDAPKGVVAVSNPESFGSDYLSLLKQSAEVIGIDEPEKRYQDLSAAA